MQNFYLDMLPVISNRGRLLSSLLWTVCLVASFVGCIFISSSAWHRFQNDPTVISIERNFREWNTTLPAATICPNTKLDYTKLEDYIESLYVNDTSDKKEIEEFLQDLAGSSYDTPNTLGELTIHGDISGNTAIPDIAHISPNDYMRRILSLKYDLVYNIPSVHGTSLLVPYITERGLCYAYNSAVAYIYTPENFYSSGSVLHNRLPSLITGSPLEGDLNGQVLGLNSAYKVSITSPHEMPDIASKYTSSNHLERNTVEFTSLATHSDADLRSLTVAQRRCRFAEESNLTLSQVYSYNLCRMQCRADLAYQLCSCVPHFYKPVDDKRTCDTSGLQCISSYTGTGSRYKNLCGLCLIILPCPDLLIKLRHQDRNEKIHCGCLSPCNDVNYVLDSHASTSPWFGTDLKWGISKHPRIRLKRKIIFGFSDFIVSIGGTAGLLLGCSVLSVVEIIYFLTLRLIIYFVQQP